MFNTFKNVSEVTVFYPNGATNTFEVNQNISIQGVRTEIAVEKILANVKNKVVRIILSNGEEIVQVGAVFNVTTERSKRSNQPTVKELAVRINKEVAEKANVVPTVPHTTPETPPATPAPVA